MSNNIPTSASTSSTSSSPSNSTPLANSTLSPSASTLFDPNVSAEHILISYQDDFGVWKYLEPELKSHLPLKNISWKTKTGHTKIVEYMPVDIISHDDERLKQPFEFPNLYRKPYLYLYLVHCDDTETYRNVTKSKIRQWVNSMAEKQQEWLIVYIQLGQKRLTDTFPKISRSVYDKIKNDFNVKRDRCCQLRFLDDSNTKNDELWDDFLFKLKEGIVSSAEQYLTLYEEEIRKSDAKRTSVGWNYLSFFFLKESLALIYERALLYEDALLQYIELEVLFTENKAQFERVAAQQQQQQQQQNLSSIFNDGVNFFNSTTRRNYRELIYQNKITLFDFKQYLFVCQSKLLFLLNRPIEVANKAISFVTSTGHIVNKNQKSFPMYFHEAWTITVSLEIVKACQNAFDKLMAAQSNSNGGTAGGASTNNPATPSTATGKTLTKQQTPPLARFLNAWNGVGNLVTGGSLSSSPVAGNSPVAGVSNSTNASGASSATNTSTGIVGKLTTSQSLTSVQSMQLQSTNWTRTPSLNSLAELDTGRVDYKQDRESLDFLLADLLFGAGQMLESLAIKLDLIAKDDLDYNSNNSEQQQPPLQITPFYKYADLIFSNNDKQEQTQTSFSPNVSSTYSVDDFTTPPQTSSDTSSTTNNNNNNNDNENKESNDSANKPKTTISTTTLFSYPPLQVAFQSPKNFKQLYMNVMTQADSLYIQTNRTRSHHRVSYSVGKMYFKLGYFSEAVAFFKSIVNLYSRESWHMIEYSIKTKLSFCQKRLNDLTEYITTCISLLSPGVLKTDEEKLYYLDEILNVSKNNQLNIAVSMYPLFKVKITTSNLECRFLDTITIDVKIKSNLFTSITAKHAAINFIKINSSSEKLIFNLTDFTINPGDNYYKFSTLGTNKATFVKDSIWIKFGNVSFGQSLKDSEKPTEIKVIETKSNIKLESFANSPLLLSCIQYIGLKLNTQSDSIEKGLLSFQSPTGVTIIQTPSYNVISRKRDGTVAMHQIPLLNEKINLSHIEPEEQLELYLPIMAINTDPCTHQITVLLEHQKQTKETFTSSLVSSTLFINPFSIEEIVIPVKDRLFLKIILQCTSSTPLIINDYSLNECDSHYVEDANARNHSFYMLKDYNESLKNMTLYPGHTLSLIFEINKYNQLDSNKSIKLCIKYINKLQDTDNLVKECKPLWKDHVEFYWPITIDCPKKYYEITSSIPTTAIIGSIIPFEFTITNILQSDDPIKLNDVTYTLEYDQSYWTISGKNKYHFNLENGKQMKFKCNLIPIACGSPPTPTINLVGISHSNIKYTKQTANQIYIYPLTKFNSSCTEQSFAKQTQPTTTTATPTKPSLLK